MNKFYLILELILVLLNSSCQKEEIPLSDPKFEVYQNIDSQMIVLKIKDYNRISTLPNDSISKLKSGILYNYAEVEVDNKGLFTSTICNLSSDQIACGLAVIKTLSHLVVVGLHYRNIDVQGNLSTPLIVRGNDSVTCSLLPQSDNTIMYNIWFSEIGENTIEIGFQYAYYNPSTKKIIEPPPMKSLSHLDTVPGYTVPHTKYYSAKKMKLPFNKVIINGLGFNFNEVKSSNLIIRHANLPE